MQGKAVCFEKSDISDLKEKLEDLLGDTEKVLCYKENAQEYICGKYNWDDIVERTVELYKGERQTE